MTADKACRRSFPRLGRWEQFHLIYICPNLSFDTVQSLYHGWLGEQIAFCKAGEPEAGSIDRGLKSEDHL